MSSVTSWKIWLVFAGVFLAGGIAGGFIALRIEDRIVERGRSPGQFVPRLVDHITDQLDLTEEQRAEMKVLADAAWQELHAQRQASRDTMQTLQKQIGEILNESQREEYRKMRESQRLRWQRLAGERRGDGPAGHPPHGAGPRPMPDGAPPPPDAPPPADQ